MSVTLRAEFFFDDEVGTWHHRVPALHFNGGSTPTRERMDAIAFALKGDPSEYDRGTQAFAFEVAVAPARLVLQGQIPSRPAAMVGGERTPVARERQVHYL